jgi:hypothetical protein
MPITNQVPCEENGGIPVNLQDQVTRPLILKFNDVLSSTTLSVDAVKDTKTIVVTSPTNFISGRYVILFDPSTNNFSFYTVVSVSGAIITLDTPLDYSYTIGTYVDIAITNMNVDGSVTPVVYGLRGIGSPPGVDISADFTRVIFNCIADSAVDLTKFGNLTRLTNGLVLRRRDGVYQNIFNIKDNGELAGICYDLTIEAANNPVQGVDGFYARLTFAGQNKIGVAIRLPLGDDLEIIIQDDLTDLLKLEVVAEGHLLAA